MTEPTTGSEAGAARARPVGKRRHAREMAVQMLYQRELGASTLDDVFASYDIADYLDRHGEESDGDTATKPKPKRGAGKKRARAEAAFDYACTLARGALEHGSEIDERIRRHAENWRLERMPSIDRNILRLAIYEMLYEEGVPKVVIVDEAIELAKKFGSENSGRFVNGLLDGVLRAINTPAVASAEGSGT